MGKSIQYNNYAQIKCSHQIMENKIPEDGTFRKEGYNKTSKVYNVQVWGNSGCPPCGVPSMEALINIGMSVECEIHFAKCHGSSNGDMQ